MRFTLEVEMDNDAFVVAPGHQLALILDHAKAQILDQGMTEAPLMDINGNTVGRWSITSD